MSYIRQEYVSSSPVRHRRSSSPVGFLGHYLTDRQINLDYLDLDSPVRLSLSPSRRLLSPFRERSRSPRSRSPTLPPRSRSRLSNCLQEAKSKVDKNRIANIIQNRKRIIKKILNENKNFEIELNKNLEKRDNYLRAIENGTISFNGEQLEMIDRRIRYIEGRIQKNLEKITSINNQTIILPNLTEDEYLSRYNRFKKRNN